MSYALISGPNTNYLWILARQPTLADEIKQRLIATAQQKGFTTSELIFVDQTTAGRK